MPTYSYRCKDDGVFDLQQKMADRAEGVCPTCGSVCKKVLTAAPELMIEAMADAGCPGAFMTSGDRMTRRHRSAGQNWSED